MAAELKHLELRELAPNEKAALLFSIAADAKGNLELADDYLVYNQIAIASKLLIALGLDEKHIDISPFSDFPFHEKCLAASLIPELQPKERKNFSDAFSKHLLKGKDFDTALNSLLEQKKIPEALSLCLYSIMKHLDPLHQADVILGILPGTLLSAAASSPGSAYATAQMLQLFSVLARYHNPSEPFIREYEAIGQVHDDLRTRAIFSRSLNAFRDSNATVLAAHHFEAAYQVMEESKNFPKNRIETLVSFFDRIVKGFADRKHRPSPAQEKALISMNRIIAASIHGAEPSVRAHFSDTVALCSASLVTICALAALDDQGEEHHGVEDEKAAPPVAAEKEGGGVAPVDEELPSEGYDVGETAEEKSFVELPGEDDEQEPNFLADNEKDDDEKSRVELPGEDDEAEFPLPPDALAPNDDDELFVKAAARSRSPSVHSAHSNELP